MKLLELTDITAYVRRQFDWWDDFFWFISPHLWTATLTDSGTAAVGDTHGGVLTLTASDGSVADNDEVYVQTTNELFLFDADATMRVGAILKYTEVATNVANVMFGLMNAPTADALIDNGGGPKATFSGAVIYKIDGGTVWRCRSSVGTTNTDTVTTITAGGAYQLLEIEAKAISLTRVQISYFIDGVQVLDPAAGYAKPLAHYLDATSATEMALVVGVKNGSAANQTVLVDGMGWSSIR